MNDETMLAMLKVDLGIIATAYDTRLGQVLNVAKAEIAKEGAALNTASSVSDANLCIMYAAWMWRKRDTMEAMPRMLRWQLNNRIFAEKMRADA